MGLVSRCGEEDGKFWIELRRDAPFTVAQDAIIDGVPASFSDPDAVEIVRRKNFVGILFRTIDRERFTACTPVFLEALDEAEIGEAVQMCAPRRRHPLSDRIRQAGIADRRVA